MTDDRLTVNWVNAALALPAGSALIVRHRNSQAREKLALVLLQVCRRRRVLLIVAEDFHLARRIHADGVHVPARLAGRIPGLRASNKDWIITTSVHSLGARLRSERLSPDAMLVSPLFETASHAGQSSLGTTRVAAIVSGSRLPCFALGGIEASNVSMVSALPVQGIALIRGWLGDASS